ncbi:MAG: hypothetical protein QNJ85_12670 [Gammaproteobacteria bacterium]|nr:hypothetical protein [Gammaproteobacteria bacterium]
MKTLVFIFLAITSDTVFACTPFHFDYGHATYVYLGQIEKIDRPWYHWIQRKTKVQIHFGIKKYWKGDPKQHIVQKTEGTFGNCGTTSYEEGEQYVVFSVPVIDSEWIVLRTYTRGYGAILDEIYKTQ